MKQPSKIATWFLRKIYGEELFDEISGDLNELFQERLQSNGKWSASFNYWIDVLLSVRNINLKRKTKQHSINQIDMLKNLISISFRSLKARASYSILNIVGLSVSMTFAFLLAVYVYGQYSYDRNNENANQIYRVNIDCNMNGKRDVYCNVPQPIAFALKSDYPEIKETVRLAMNDHIGVLEHDGKKHKSEQLLIAEPTIFQFFNRKFIHGNPAQALTEPNTIVIDELLALKIFGSTDVLGKDLLFVDEKKLMKVTGVMAKDENPTHLPFEAILSWATFRDWEVDWWYGAHAYTYILINEASSIANLETQMPAFFSKYMKETFDKKNGTANLFFQPLKDIYLSEEYVWELYPHGNRFNVLVLSIVATLLIAFAGINYVNLATARATERSREVGIRKVLGSTKRSLQFQFLTESLLLSLSSGVLALFLAWILLPYFNQLVGMNLTGVQWFSLKNISYILLIAFSVGLFAGLFPAFYLSSLQTLEVLKGKFSNSNRGEGLRKILVTSQYFIAAILISSLILIYQQTNFIKSKDIGFIKDNLISIQIPRDSSVNNHLSPFIDALKSLSNVTSVSLASLDLDKTPNSFTPTLQNEDGTSFQMGADNIYVDDNFLQTIGATIVKGRGFDSRLKTESESSILINETAVKKFGWTKNPLGGKFHSFTEKEEDQEPRNIVGVVKDFHLGVSYQKVKPMLIFFGERGRKNIYVRILKGDTEEIVSTLAKKWQEHFPNHSLEYNFVNQSLNAQYKNEERFLNLLSSFCFIVLLITSLGVIGLISYTTQLKKKEIAIRKVLGSSIKSIAELLSGKFVSLLLIANLLAFPVSWYLANSWLNNFYYRIELSFWPFMISFCVCLFFTVISLLFHVVQAAKASPIESLKYE
jgi:putative ABC transport system permease protein